MGRAVCCRGRVRNGLEMPDAHVMHARGCSALHRLGADCRERTARFGLMFSLDCDFQIMLAGLKVRYLQRQQSPKAATRVGAGTISLFLADEPIEPGSLCQETALLRVPLECLISSSLRSREKK